MPRSAPATALRPESIKGSETPRLWTKPLRELTPETSHGFSVIAFAAQFLGITLYPWQKWLLIHALELREDGTYRFRKVVVLVARQNGKSTLLIVLALWWLHVDADLQSQHIDPHDFLVLGVAQSLEAAEGFWAKTVAYMNPDDPEQHVPALAKYSKPPVLGTGKKAVSTNEGATYTVRAANRKAGRGKSASRIIMDETREQQTWDAWAAISKTMNNTWNPQLWAISNAGDARSVVLMHQHELLLEAVKDWDDYVASGAMAAEEWANSHDESAGLFEWSADPELPIDDVTGWAQANPALGHGHMKYSTLLSDFRGDPEGVFRTEVLCQWVTAKVDTWLSPLRWSECADEESRPADDAVIYLGVDTAARGTTTGQGMSYLGIAALREDGTPHVEVIAQRAGMLWVVDAVVEVCQRWGIYTVAIQGKGAPASEFITALEAAGIEVFRVEGSGLGASTGQIRDMVRDGRVRHRDQPVLNVAVSGGTARRVGEAWLWDRIGSVVDIAPLVAVTNALYAMDQANYTTRSAYESHGLMVI